MRLHFEPSSILILVQDYWLLLYQGIGHFKAQKPVCHLQPQLYTKATDWVLKFFLSSQGWSDWSYNRTSFISGSYLLHLPAFDPSSEARTFSKGFRWSEELTYQGTVCAGYIDVWTWIYLLISAQILTSLLPVVGTRSALGIRCGNLLPCARVHDGILHSIQSGLAEGSASLCRPHLPILRQCCILLPKSPLAFLSPADCPAH